MVAGAARKWEVCRGRVGGVLREGEDGVGAGVGWDGRAGGDGVCEW